MFEIGAEHPMPVNPAIEAMPQGDGGHGRGARKRRTASASIATNSETGAVDMLPQSAANQEMPPGGQVHGLVARSSHNAHDLAAIIAEMRELQSQRRFCIKSQSRCDRSIESFIARGLGFNAEQDEKQRKAAFAEAQRIRREVEKGGIGREDHAGNRQGQHADAAPLILLSAQARQSWDAHRTQTEKRMEVLAKSLPVWAWASGVRGLGPKGVAIIVGEAGDLSNYATVEKLWKRLGLAVINGERQQRKSGADAAKEHGYSPARRAEIWAVADSFFRHQWRGAKDDAPAHAISIYGEIYARRKAATEGRDWTLGHRDADARRVMTKALVEHLWRAWKACAANTSEGESIEC